MGKFHPVFANIPSVQASDDELEEVLTVIIRVEVLPELCWLDEVQFG